MSEGGWIPVVCLTGDRFWDLFFVGGISHCDTWDVYHTTTVGLPTPSGAFTFLDAACPSPEKVFSTLFSASCLHGIVSRSRLDHDFFYRCMQGDWKPSNLSKWYDSEIQIPDDFIQSAACWGLVWNYYCSKDSWTAIYIYIYINSRSWRVVFFSQLKLYDAECEIWDVCWQVSALLSNHMVKYMCVGCVKKFGISDCFMW